MKLKAINYIGKPISPRKGLVKCIKIENSTTNIKDIDKSGKGLNYEAA